MAPTAFESIDDNGGAEQRRVLQAAGILVAKDALLRPTTTMLDEADAGPTPGVVACLLLDVTRGEPSSAAHWLRATADLLELTDQTGD